MYDVFQTGQTSLKEKQGIRGKNCKLQMFLAIKVSVLLAEFVKFSVHIIWNN